MQIHRHFNNTGKLPLILKFLIFLISGFVFQVNGQKSAIESTQDLLGRATEGDPMSQNVLGWNYSQGIGVVKSNVEAAKWFHKAADQNLASAQYNLGYCYSRGEGVMQDHDEAFKWFKKAAIQNHAKAQYSVGYGYCEGEGVKKDYREAAKWFQKAAFQNIADSQSSLAACFELGLGTVKNETEAYKWYLLAGAQGHESARQGMSRLEERLTREQIADGQAMAREFMELKSSKLDVPESANEFDDSRPKSTGTGFFITEDGFLITTSTRHCRIEESPTDD